MLKQLFTFSLTFSLTTSTSHSMEFMHDEILEAQNAPLSKPASSSMGALFLKGEVGSRQKFNRAKLAKCTVALKDNSFQAQRSSCDAHFFIDVNETLALEAGFYILGYENSIYPGFIEIKSDETQTIELIKIQAPTNSSETRIYVDYARLEEQKKLYFVAWTLGHQMFLQSEYEFGDFYLTSWPQKPAVPRLSYNYCQGKGTLSEEATHICRAWNGESFMDTIDLFDFDEDARYHQFAVGRPGGVFRYSQMKHLVSPPLQSDEFAYVLPGKYLVVSTDNKNRKASKRITVGVSQENYGALAPPQILKRIQKPELTVPETVLEQNQSEVAVLPVNPCSNARMWRTEKRAYCRGDQEEGCNRTTALACERQVPFNF
ncbi:MAG: hypothetical protein AB7F59_12025 [Bdellovibrionales bacterium]